MPTTSGPEISKRLNIKSLAPRPNDFLLGKSLVFDVASTGLLQDDNIYQVDCYDDGHQSQPQVFRQFKVVLTGCVADSKDRGDATQ
jgi:hypothetical protein